VSDETKDPAGKVGIDLDALEREGQVPEAFVFNHDGVSYTLLDPQEIDWQDLLAGLRNPALFIRFALPIDQQRDFFSKRVPSWKMNRLMQAYQDHYGLPDLGNVSALRT
jgi:hypothetical protein